ncbi:MAG: DMT family transporter [Lachnoclostridium sp.]|nr:DMT family transporter [Lachnoclostridium sp.]
MSRRHSDRKKTSLIWYHLGAVLIVLAWGISFVSTKVLLENGLHPIEIYIYRFLLAYLFMLIISHKRFSSNSWRDEGLFLVCGLCGGSLYYISENVALEYTLVSNVSLITSLSPIITAMLLGALYKSERPSNGLYIGSLIAFIGVGFVIFNSSFMLDIKPMGDLLALLSAFTWSIYSLVLRKLNVQYDALFITRKTFFYGVVTALPFLAVEPNISSPTLLLRPAVIGNILFLALFASLIAFLLWTVVVGKLGAVKASNYIYFQPVVTLIFSAIILSERISVVGITGCILILIGVWLADWLPRRKSLARK